MSFAAKISREEEGDDGEYAVIRALGFKVRVTSMPRRVEWSGV